MSGLNAERSAGTKTLENDALVLQLKEVASGLLKLCDSLATANTPSFQQAVDEDYQASGGTTESLPDHRLLPTERADREEPDGPATYPLADPPKMIPPSCLQKDLFSFRIANGMEVPYGSPPPYPLAADLAFEASEAATEGSELVDFYDNVSQVPHDGRIILSPGSRRMSYMQWTQDFCMRLEAIGGAFWIRDFDLLGRIKHYHYGHTRCAIARDGRVHRRRESIDVSWLNPHREDEAAFDAPPAIWPQNQADYECIWRREALPVPQAPWKRLILLQGLSMMMGFMECSGESGNGLQYSKGEREDLFNTRALVPFFHDSAVDQVIQRYLGMFGMHNANCVIGNPIKARNGSAFLITWFQTGYYGPKFDDLRSRRNGKLRAGPLYNDRHGQTLEQESFAIFAIPGDETQSMRSNKQTLRDLPREKENRVLHPHNYWTILVLSPPSWYESSLLDPVKIEAPDIGVSSMQRAALDLIAGALHDVALEWSNICHYTEETLGSTANIFGLALDDKLLFDDENFSDSRKYSWLINSAHEFAEMISATIHAWEEYRAGYVEPYLNIGTLIPSDERKAILSIVSKIEKTLQNLGYIEEKFVRQKGKSVALRDGLFAASSVRESKTSSRLAENIKLLTYVSIFYLPLTFCVSIWSTSDTLGYTAMAITTVTVGLATYLIVLNLNRLAAGCATYYAFRKQIIVQQMKNDTRWKNIGRRFEQYQPLTIPQLKPSEWLVAIYWLARVSRPWKTRTLESASKEEMG
ncbi:MAG: hypothetical protein Q9216_004149 [Gyalolechia sp. 2 TL-2023]